MTIHNAKITSTMLGPEDHGVMTFMIHLEFDGSGIGYGGYALDRRNHTFNICVPNDAGRGYQAMRCILETVGVASWEKLSGTLCRIEFDGGPGKVLRIGHILENYWFDLAGYMRDRT